jgi:hypothetical protein
VSNRSAQPGTRPSDAAFDDHQLARRARTTLAGADLGVLLTGDDRGKILRPISVRLMDDNGAALIRCAQGSAVAQAASDHRLAILVLAPNPSFGVRLTLRGRLCPAGGRGSGVGSALCNARHTASADPDIFVALHVDHVDVGCPRELPDGVPSGQRTVPTALYADAAPDLFAANIPRLVQHVNEHHSEPMRRLAAHTVGVPPSRLAAACLTELTAERASLCWLDEHGAHPAVLPFARPARTLQELAATLRACVTAADVTRS